MEQAPQNVTFGANDESSERLEQSASARFIHSNTEAGHWIVEVTVSSVVSNLEGEVTSFKETFLVYVNERQLDVHPAGTQRSTFEWTDWIFDNGSDVLSGAVIAALAVSREV